MALIRCSIASAVLLNLAANVFPAAVLAQQTSAPAAVAASATTGTIDASTPDGLIRTMSSTVLNQIKVQKIALTGDKSQIMALVDQKIMPYVDFQRMTASAVGRSWNQATPDQQKTIQQEFKTLLIRTYAGALTQVKDQVVNVKPLRAAPTDNEVVVRTNLTSSSSNPISLDYRVEKAPAGWRIFDVNVAGVWLIETYRSDFGSVINANGITGLITALKNRNKTNAADAASSSS